MIRLTFAVFALIGMHQARAAKLGCYEAQKIWVDYPQRVLGSDFLAVYQIIPTTEDVFRTTFDFINGRSTRDVICLKGVNGPDYTLHVWEARVVPRNMLKAESRDGDEGSPRRASRR